MEKTSSIISRIRSTLHSVVSNQFYRYSLALSLVIGLRNLNVLLICLRYMEIDGNNVMQSLLSRVEFALGRIPTDNVFSLALYQSVSEVNSLTRELNDEWYTDTLSNRLTLDDMVQIADFIMQNIDDFWVVCWNMSPDASTLRGHVMDEFEVQSRFLREFLIFVKWAGVKNQPLQHLLIQIRSFVMNAARGFMIDGDLLVANEDWAKNVPSMCPRMNPQVFQAYAQTLLSISALDLAHVVLKDFLGSLISLLWHLLRHPRHPHHSDSLKALYETLRLSRVFLKQQQQSNNDEIEGPIRILILDAGIMVCSLYYTDVDAPSFLDLLQRFDVVETHVRLKSNSLKATALDFGHPTTLGEISNGKVQTNSAIRSNQSSSSEEVGFQEDEVTSILDRLTRGSKQLRLLPISGMTGLGKTTLAIKVYNHRSVVYHFQARAWCTISHVLDKKRVLFQLLNQIHPGYYLEMNEDDLANKLRQCLKRKRYLILLDDVWTPQVWESLRPSFPDDTTQSRILFTSRLHNIIPDALLDEQPHFLRLRKESECLEIIEMKLQHNVGLRIELEKFSKLCKGLPLIAVLVAGILSTTMQKDWKGIRDHLSLGGMSCMEQCNIALELSYEHLPDNLKLCFIYFGVFPEDEEIYAQKLIRLWMAEGFVTTKNGLLLKRIEDVAQDYLDSLIQRNLVMVIRKKSIGGVKTCRVHDLLHDFCLMKGKHENLFHLLQQRHDGLSDFNEPCNLVRLSIHSDARHFKKSGLFCPLARTMLFFDSSKNVDDSRLSDMSFIIQTFKLLKVLDVDWIWFITQIPSEIAFLTRLTYLSIGSRVPIIPSSIGNLPNLETLIVRFMACEAISLPNTIWDLQKLKYICITGHCNFPGFSLPIENREKYLKLLELEAICGVILYSDGIMERQMKKCPNIRKLKCHILCGGESLEKLNKLVMIPEYLSELEFLNLCAERKLKYELDFGSTAENLRKVTLQRFVLSREEIAVIGKLPNLEVLKLVGIHFVESIMEMEDDEFSKLRILVLRSSYECSNLETWTVVGDDPLPCLEKLVFRSCAKLREIPYLFLETSLTLEEIELSNCSTTLETLVTHIQEVQEDFGNSIKVRIYPNS